MNIHQTILSLFQKLRIDHTFSNKLKISAKLFNARFSEKEIYILQSACKKQPYRTAIKKIDESYAEKDSTPVVTIVIMGCDTEYNIEKCFFILSKQILRNIQILLIGKKNYEKYKKISNISDLTFIKLKSDLNAHNAHVLAAPYIKGKYLVFIKPTDQLHPAFCKELVDLAEKYKADLVLTKAVESTDVLPSVPLEPEDASTIYQEEYLTSFRGGAECSETDLFGKLFCTEKWQEVIKKKFGDNLLPWLRILHFLEYISSSKIIITTRSPLIRHGWYDAGYMSLVSYTAGLKIGVRELEGHLREKFSDDIACMILRKMIFRSIPARLSFLTLVPRSLLRMTVIYSHIAFYLEACRKIFPNESGKISSITLAGLSYGRFMSSTKVFSVHDYFIREERFSPNGILVYETEKMEDIKNNFLSLLQSRYPVRYMLKKSFNEDTQLEYLLCALLAAKSVFILASNRIDSIATSGRKIVQSWHGYGLMKKILPASSDPVKASRFRQNYVVASSEGCKKEYSSIFSVPEENVLSFGSVQTDRYFDIKERDKAIQEANSEFPDLSDKRVCFFAPTFRKTRAEDPPRYTCGWDYSDIDDKLAQAKTAIVYKEHHIFKNFKYNKGISGSDLKESTNGMVKETAFPDIFTWICACDIFMTDFSSAMFLPLLLNKPIVFFAPDLKDYLSRGAGTLIDYRKDVPGPIVESSSIDDLLVAMDNAVSYPESYRYQRFKAYHMGSCDGFARKRLIDFIDEFYQKELDKIIK